MAATSSAWWSSTASRPPSGGTDEDMGDPFEGCCRMFKRLTAVEKVWGDPAGP